MNRQARQIEFVRGLIKALRFHNNEFPHFNNVIYHYRGRVLYLNKEKVKFLIQFNMKLIKGNR